MKPLVLAVGACVLAALFFQAQAQGPDDAYVRVYILINQGDNLNSNGQKREAVDKYNEARNELQALQSANPEWNPDMVRFRFDDIANKLASLGEAGAPKPEVKSEPVPLDPEVVARQIKSLERQLGSARNDKHLLELKLKEALSARPADADPRQLARAESRILTLEKENQILRTAVDNAKANAAQLAKATTPETESKTSDRAMVKLEKMVAEQRETIAALKQDKESLDDALKAYRKNKREKQLENQVASLQKEVAKLEKDSQPRKRFSFFGRGKKRDVRDDAGSLAEARQRIQELAEENQQLVHAVEQAKAEATAKPVADDSSSKGEREVAGLEKMVDEQKSTIVLLEQDNNRLKMELKAQEKSDREKQLVDQVKSLGKELAKLRRKEQSGKKRISWFSGGRERRAEKARTAELENRVKTMKARLDVLDAQDVPLTEDELAVVGKSKGSLITPEQVAASEKAQLDGLPEGANELYRKAKDARVARDYNKAEQQFEHILKLDEDNVFTRAQLAAVQIEQGRYDEAEANLKKALEDDPDEAWSLAHYGLLKYRQEKYDEALDFLSKAVKEDPTVPGAQYVLGSTLFHLGKRDAAQKAYRKALQISPKHVDSHYSLALVYSLQQPPFTELARYHYNAAVKGGHEKNSDLEKKLDLTGSN